MTDLGEAGRDADLVIEAVPEDLELKQTVFSKLDECCPVHTILATNTSSMSVTEIGAATRRQDKIIGLHFFNPVPLMPLLEIVRADATADQTVDAALALARRLGKEAIVVRDTPGFASSRLGLALGLEAMRMLEQGVASAEEIRAALDDVAR